MGNTEVAIIERTLTMAEAMQYLNERGITCKTRATFYRFMSDFNMRYRDINPWGKNRIRRFSVVDLDGLINSMAAGGTNDVP